MVVTPEVAERWLNSNSHNRPLRPGWVEQIASRMKNGEWKLTAEPIAFCGPYNDECNEPQGVTLLEGQHRLWGVIESGVACEFTVWWGCEPDEFSVIGQCAPRTLGDVLSTTRRDLVDPTLVASICSSAAKYAFGYGSKSVGAMGSTKLRPAQVASMLLYLEPEILAVADYKKELRKMAPRTVVSALLLARIANQGMADLIVRQLKDAVGFTERDPVRALHLYITSQITESTRDTLDTMHYKVCHAIAARMRGDQLRVLRITGDGLGWLRDASKAKIQKVAEALHGGKVPQNFYTPKLLAAA